MLADMTSEVLIVASDARDPEPKEGGFEVRVVSQLRLRLKVRSLPSRVGLGLGLPAVICVDGDSPLHLGTHIAR